MAKEKKIKRKMKHGIDVIEKKRKTTKVKHKKRKLSGRKEDTFFHLHNNIFIRKLNENKIEYEKITNVEKLFAEIKATIVSLNIENVNIQHHESFIFHEKNKMDFVLPELDNLINSSNIELLKKLCQLSFYPIYNEMLSKKVLEWLTTAKSINKSKAKKGKEKSGSDLNVNKAIEHIGRSDVRDFSYSSSLNVILTSIIYKNQEYSNYCCLIYLNTLQWLHSKRMGLNSRYFILKGIMKHFNYHTHLFIDKKLLKSKKTDDTINDEEELDLFKNIFVSLYNSIEYVDVSNFVDINERNCIFELTKFYLDLLKKPLVYSLHVLCVNYLIKLIKKCYEYRFTYNIDLELYDLGPKVNLFTRVVNLIFAKILSVLKEIKNDENLYTVEHIKSINNLIITFFKNILNSCIRIIVPQIHYNDHLKNYYLMINEQKYVQRKKENPEMSFEDKVVLNACDPIFSFVEISLINHCEKYEKNIFIEFIKILIRECKKVERKYNIFGIISDEFMSFLKKEDKKDRGNKVNDNDYLIMNLVDNRRLDSSLSFNLSDAYSSSVGSETEEDDEEEEEKKEEEKEEEKEKEKEDKNKIVEEEKKSKHREQGGEGDANNEDSVSDDDNEKDDKMDNNEQKLRNAERRRKEKNIKHTEFSLKLHNKRICTIIFNNKEYVLSYESIMIRYLNFLIKYINCEKYQIRNIILDLFFNLIKKKKTNKNESILNNLFKLFLERIEDPNVIVKGKALSILIELTNPKYHDNSIIYNFIFNKSKEKINMYKIISSNVYNHKSSIRKLIVQYIDIIFEALINNGLSYNYFLHFVSDYLYNLSLDAISSVRKQVLLTVNNLFTLVNDNLYLARLWVTVIFSAITDIEETVKDEAINIFINTFIRHYSECPIFNKTEKEIKDVLKKNKLIYFKVETQDEDKEEGQKGKDDYKTINDQITLGLTKLTKKKEKLNEVENISTETVVDGVIKEKEKDNIVMQKEYTENDISNRGVYDKNNDGITNLINIHRKYFKEEIDNYFVDILKVITKYDLLYFNIFTYCLKDKKNQYIEEFITYLNTFIFNLRYFSIKCWNLFIFDFIIELSKFYKDSFNIENIMFLLNRCYKVYLVQFVLKDEENQNEKEIKEKPSIEENERSTNTNTKENVSKGSNFTFMSESLSDYILGKEHFIEENKNCANNVLKNIMLKLFIIFDNLLDTATEVKEEFLERMEYTIFNFNCPICFIYIILKILMKKRKDIDLFIEKLKSKIVYFVEHVEMANYNIIFCNILMTFVFLINHFKDSENFLLLVNDKLKKIFENANKGSASNNGISTVMLKNCIYITQSVLLIEKNINIKSDVFQNFEKDLKNVNTSMNVVNNLIILIYYMIVNFGSTCNKFIYILLRFFKHDNSYIRYLSFYVLAKLISEDYIKFNNHFFCAFLYLLADKNEIIRKQSLSVFKHVLLLYNKSSLINNIIEFIFVLNNCYTFKMSKHLAHIGNSFEVKTKEYRYDIYCFVIENLTNSEKFSLQQKLINEYLVQYVYNYDNFFFADEKSEGAKHLTSIIPLNPEENEGAVLFDVLNILNSKLMKIKIKKDFAKLEEEKNKHFKVKSVETSAKVLHDMMKNILRKNSLPILLSLRAIMLKTKSYFFQHINNLILYLCYDYKDVLDELISETNIKNEIFNEIQNFAYVDLLQLHKEQSFLFNRDINVNFFELSEEKFLHNEKEEKENPNDYKENISSSDYDEASDVLHGLDSVHIKNRKKKKKKHVEKKKKIESKRK